jgi:hypothetical protein
VRGGTESGGENRNSRDRHRHVTFARSRSAADRPRSPRRSSG